MLLQPLDVSFEVHHSLLHRLNVRAKCLALWCSHLVQSTYQMPAVLNFLLNQLQVPFWTCLEFLVLHLYHLQIIFVLVGQLSKSLSEVFRFLLVQVHCICFIVHCSFSKLRKLFFHNSSLNQQQLFFVVYFVWLLLAFIFKPEVILRNFKLFSFSRLNSCFYWIYIVLIVLISHICFLKSNYFIFLEPLYCFFEKCFLRRSKMF